MGLFLEMTVSASVELSSVSIIRHANASARRPVTPSSAAELCPIMVNSSEVMVGLAEIASKISS